MYLTLPPKGSCFLDPASDDYSEDKYMTQDFQCPLNILH